MIQVTIPDDIKNKVILALDEVPLDKATEWAVPTLTDFVALQPFGKNLTATKEDMITLLYFVQHVELLKQQSE